MQSAKNSQRAIIFFLWKEGSKPAEIARRLQAVFGDDAESRATVYRWVDRFKSGQETLEDDERSGRPRTSLSKEHIQLVADMVMENRRVTVREIADFCGIGVARAHAILRDELLFTKLSARWVPRLLGADQKHNRAETCRHLLRLAEQYGEAFWQRIVTVDETWLPYYNPETKEQSREWRRPEEGHPIKARAGASSRKTMVTVFWDTQGVIHIDYLETGTINAAYYAELLKGPVRQKLAEKRPGKLHARPLLQHDNARPHTASHTVSTIGDLRWELLPHPAYSPDLAPSDYHLFGPMKKSLRGHHFSCLTEVKRVLNRWVDTTPRSFFDDGLRKLVQRWKKCVDLKGDYVEKCDDFQDWD